MFGERKGPHYSPCFLRSYAESVPLATATPFFGPPSRFSTHPGPPLSLSLSVYFFVAPHSILGLTQSPTSLAPTQE